MTPEQANRDWDWEIPVPIRYGPGRLREVAALCLARGVSNPLIVTDRASARLAFVDATRGFLDAAGLGCAVFSDVSPNPTDREVTRGRDVFVSGGHDAVIALGGGSGMDAGKAISLVAGNDHPLWDFDFDRTPPAGLSAPDFPPVMCIPTTAGTGAETESTAMITDTSREIKGCVWHPAQKPFAVILDPEVTLSLPRNLTAWTGCDALVHAIEAYCVPALHPVCDGAALEALRLVYRSLPEALARPASIEARGAMLVGSCLAGISFLKGLGLVHAVSHMIGAEFDTHHGLTNAVILPAVLRFNEVEIGAKITPMCQAMGLEGTDFAAFMDAIAGLLDLCEIPRDLAALGVTATAAPRLARKAHLDPAAGTNPRSASVEEISALILAAITKAR